MTCPHPACSPEPGPDSERSIALPYRPPGLPPPRTQGVYYAALMEGIDRLKMEALMEVLMEGDQ